MINHSRTRLLGLLCTCLSFCLLPVRAQGIADNSNSVIVEAQTEVICKSMTQSVERETRTVTILNKKGLDAAHFFCSCDMFRSLQKFSGELINASGQSVRKIKKSELLKSEYSSSLSTDDYLYYYECNYPSFPFTVKYVWEVKCNNGLIGYSTFMPQTDFNQGVEKSAYRIELPAGQQCRHRALNTDCLLYTSSFAPDTTATAIYLFRKGESSFAYKDGFQLVTEHWVRIKVLKPQGVSYADITVPYYSPSDKDKGQERASEINGCSYNMENGQCVETPLKRDLISDERVNQHIRLLKFSIPAVKEGTLSLIHISGYKPSRIT